MALRMSKGICWRHMGQRSVKAQRYVVQGPSYLVLRQP